MLRLNNSNQIPEMKSKQNHQAFTALFRGYKSQPISSFCVYNFFILIKFKTTKHSFLY